MQTTRMKSLATTGTMLMVLFPMLAHSDQAPILAEVNLYSQSMAQLEGGEGNKTLSEVYANGRVVAEKLARVLESLSNDDYAISEKGMKGFFVFREETVGVLPDMKFFKELAGRRGTRGDVEFFSLMIDVYHDGTWPAFIQQQTDYSGCTVFGDGTLTKLYIEATKLKKTASATYQKQLGELIEEIQSNLTEVVCVCGNADSVIKELTLFSKSAPNADFIAEIKSRITEVKARKSKDRFVCHSG